MLRQGVQEALYSTRRRLPPRSLVRQVKLGHFGNGGKQAGVDQGLLAALMKLEHEGMPAPGLSAGFSLSQLTVISSALMQDTLTACRTPSPHA